MAKNKEEKLFAEFPEVTTEQWEAAITADLKGADYEKKLVWRTAEGFNVRPYYRAENLSGLKFLGSQPGQFPYVRGIKTDNKWLLHQTFNLENPAQGNAHIKELIAADVESVGICVGNKDFTAEDLATLLDGICLKKIELTFCGCGAKTVAGLFIEYVKKGGYDPEDIKANFTIDPIIKNLTLKGKSSCIDSGKSFETIKSLIEAAAPYKRLRFIGVNGQQFQNCGSTIVQELAFTLAVGHEYVVKLMEAGLSVDQVAPSIRFTMGISANYFMEIAKFRAARMLWATIMSQYEPKRGCSVKMKAHGVTSRWNQTVYDPYVNMLRGTTEALSAAIAGVYSLEVTPFDTPYEAPSEFSSRIARGVQHLLKEESHIDRVVDPSGGSYYVENLTESIAENAWNLFKQVEEKGGYIEAFKSGFIREQVEASAAKKNMNIATRREILLGTNQYPNFLETAGEKVTEETITPQAPGCGCGCKSQASYEPLKPYRGAMEFEQIRFRTEKSGKQPKAFMLTAGSLAFARARAQFSCNFFACAGIKVIDNTFFHSLEEGVKEAKASGAEIVVLCASDDDYATLAPQAKQMLGDDVIFVVAGAPACQEELEAQGIKNFISVRSNVLETLKYYLSELGI